MVGWGVVWCGVEWCGVVWCGVVGRGVVWCGLIFQQKSFYFYFLLTQIQNNARNVTQHLEQSK